MKERETKMRSEIITLHFKSVAHAAAASAAAAKAASERAATAAMVPCNHEDQVPTPAGCTDLLSVGSFHCRSSSTQLLGLPSNPLDLSARPATAFPLSAHAACQCRPRARAARHRT